MASIFAISTEWKYCVTIKEMTKILHSLISKHNKQVFNANTISN